MLRVIDKKVYNTKVPIFLYGEIDSFEEGAIDQLKNLASLPFVFHHVAGMSDLHLGYGMPIGGVMATTNAIVPYAIGYDISCGVIYVPTSIKAEYADVHTLKKLAGLIRSRVPVGTAHQKYKCKECELPELPRDSRYEHVIFYQYEKIKYQLGTLGGSNHFIEIQVDEDGFIGIMIHCGSRNIGKRVCEYYNKKAIEINERYYSKVPKSWQLAFLPIDTQEAQDYLTEMDWCMEFALRNRKNIMKTVLGCLSEVFFNEPVLVGSEIDISHNYVAQEHHYGRNVWVHRKGATLAREGTVGLIPGSCGSHSYIVKGKGCDGSFTSCSHGAGRAMSRNAAKNGKLDLEVENNRIKEIGSVTNLRNNDNLDEAPGSYKDISKVMANQSELVNIVVELKPLITVKG